MRRRKIFVTLAVAVVLILLVAGSTLAATYGEPQMGPTATTIVPPACDQDQARVRAQCGTASNCPGFSDADGDGVCDRIGASENSEPREGNCRGPGSGCRSAGACFGTGQTN